MQNFIPVYVVAGLAVVSFGCTFVCFIIGFVNSLLWNFKFIRFRSKISKVYRGVLLPLFPVFPRDFARIWKSNVAIRFNPWKLLQDESVAMDFVGLAELKKTNEEKKLIDPADLNREIEGVVKAWKSFSLAFKRCSALFFLTFVLFFLVGIIGGVFGMPGK